MLTVIDCCINRHNIKMKQKSRIFLHEVHFCLFVFLIYRSSALYDALKSPLFRKEKKKVSVP